MKFQKFFSIFKINFQGFTILEASLVLAIMAIFFAMGFTSTEILSYIRLNSDVAGVYQVIKKAQSLSLSPRLFGSERICGYGIKILGDKKTYQIIKIATSGNVSDPCDLSASLQEVYEYKLKPGNEFTTSSQDKAFVYTSPYLEVKSNNVNFPFNIEIINKNLNKTATITVNNFGYVEIKR